MYYLILASMLAEGSGFPDIDKWITRITTLVNVVGTGIFTITLIIGGIMLMTSVGNERRSAQAKGAIGSAIIGFIVIIAVNTLIGIIKQLVS